MSSPNPGATVEPETMFTKLSAWMHSDAAQKWLGALVILVICVVSFWLAAHPKLVLHLGRWGYVGAFFISLVASATIVLPAPGIMVVIAMSAALNPYALGVVAGVGSALGELTGYAAGRGGSAFIPETQRQQVERLHKLTEKYGVLVLAALAALPLPIFDFAGIVAGMLKMPVLAFLAAVSVGKSIKYIFLILLGTAPLHMLQHFFK